MLDPVAQIHAQASLGLLEQTDLDTILARLEWLSKARPDQKQPLQPDEFGMWFLWLLMAGRGAGKTRTGAEETWWEGYTNPGSRIAIVGPTSNDCRKVCFEGESGLIACMPKGLVHRYSSNDLTLHMSNSTIIQGYSAEEPNRLRGPQHHFAWVDELAAWRYLQDTWDQLMFGLRLGQNPRVIATTTPRPLALLKDLLKSPTTRLSTATTYDNQDNLARIFIEKIVAKYEGSRLGRQELLAHILDEVPGALWNMTELDKNRVVHEYDPEQPSRAVVPEFMDRICVAVDPPASQGPDADECGIMVGGRARNKHGYLLADRTVQGLSPEGWARQAVTAYWEFDADILVCEVNNGGDMVEHTIKQVDRRVKVKKVHASRGKVIRAEPVATLYEQGRVHHVGTFAKAEDQMCAFTTDFDKKTRGYSPDRVDAVVWLWTELMVTGSRYNPGALAS